MSDNALAALIVLVRAAERANERPLTIPEENRRRADLAQAIKLARETIAVEEADHA